MGSWPRRLALPRLSWVKGVDSIRGGQPPGGPKQYTNTGMVRGEWLLLALPQAVRVSLRAGYLFVGGTVRGFLFAFVGSGLGCRSTSSSSAASACCWTVCSRQGVASFCEVFSVSRHSLVSLCSLKAYLAISFVHSRTCQAQLRRSAVVDWVRLSLSWLVPCLVAAARFFSVASSRFVACAWVLGSCGFARFLVLGVC